MNTHFKNVRVHGSKVFLGLRLGYEYLKPDAFYFGINILGAAANHGFHESFERVPVHQSNGFMGFGNFEMRFGYTISTSRWLATPFLSIHLVIRKLVLAARSSQTLRPACIAPVIPQALLQHRLRLAQILGALFAKFQLLNHSVYIGGYSFSSGTHHHHFNEGMSYLGGGIRSPYECSQIFNLGVNFEIFASIYTSEHWKFWELKRTYHHGLWGGEIGFPLIWRVGSKKKWDIQLEPYFLKLTFSEIQNIYGIRLIFDYYF